MNLPLVKEVGFSGTAPLKIIAFSVRYQMNISEANLISLA